MNKIFERIEQERKANGIAVDEFIMMLGYKTRCIYYDVWKPHPERIKLGTIIKMADLLNVSVDYILTGKK